MFPPPPYSDEKLSLPYSMAPATPNYHRQPKSATAKKYKYFAINGDRHEHSDFWDQLSGVEAQFEMTPTGACRSYAIPVTHKPTGKRGVLRFKFSPLPDRAAKEHKSLIFFVGMALLYLALIVSFYVLLKCADNVATKLREHAAERNRH